MSAALAPAWPGSRVLLAWWRGLSERKPRQMRVGRFLLHRVEALVRVRRAHPLDRWQRALLQFASARVPLSGEWISSLKDLQLDEQFLGQLVRQLTALGLLHRNGAGLWQLTPAGRKTLETGSLDEILDQRRTFAFLDKATANLSPSFFPLDRPWPTGLSSPTPDTASPGFEIARLETCINQSPEWKSLRRFPSDVEALLLPDGTDVESSWRRVIVDAVTTQWFAFLDFSPVDEEACVKGFPARSEDWTLDTKPLATLSKAWRDDFPELFDEPSPQQWRQAWRDWSQPRGLNVEDIEASRLERVEHRLIVHAPPRLLERLRTLRSDAIKQEAWLLSGEGTIRTAAQLEIQSQ